MKKLALIALAAATIATAQPALGPAPARADDRLIGLGIDLVIRGTQAAIEAQRQAERRKARAAAAEAERHRVATLKRTKAGRAQLAREASAQERQARRNERFFRNLFGGSGSTSGGSGGGQRGSACGPSVSQAECDFARDRQFATGSPY